MADAIPLLSSPLFCLGGTFYPVDPGFDWSSDKDVLIDAVRQTHEALRTHHIATLTPDRSWLDCECVDPADHRDLLVSGHAWLVDLVLTLEPGAMRSPRRAWRLPVNAMFLRAVQALLIIPTLDLFTALPSPL